MAKIIFVLAAIMMLMNGIVAVDHIVGDDSGWSTPSSTNFYSSWADRQNIVVNDTLVFNFNTDAHTVAMVPREAFDACDAGNAQIHNVGPTEITLNETGTFFFICTVNGHCESGQKLAVNVTDSGDSPDPTSPILPGPTSPTIPGPPSEDTGSSASPLPFTSLFSVSFMAFVVALLS